MSPASTPCDPPHRTSKAKVTPHATRETSPRRSRGLWQCLVLIGLAFHLLAGCGRPEPLPTLLPTLPPPPSATPTPTAAPTATVTPTPTVTPQPSPLPSSPIASPESVPIPRLLDAEPLPLHMPPWLADLDWALYAWLVQVLASTPRGHHYLEQIDQYQTEWLQLQYADPAFAQRTHDLLMAWQEPVRALQRGEGATFRLEPALVRESRAYLEDLAARGSPSLAQAIAAESAVIPWGGLENAPLDAAWQVILQAPPPPTPLFTPPSPPAGTPLP